MSDIIAAAEFGAAELRALHGRTTAAFATERVA